MNLRLLRQQITSQQSRRSQLRDRIAQHRVGDTLRGGHQKRVFDEQVVLIGAELGAQRRCQQLRPQLPLDRDLGMITVDLVEGVQRRTFKFMARAVRPKPVSNRLPSRSDLLLGRQHRPEPPHQRFNVRCRRVHMMLRNSNKTTVHIVEQMPVPAIGDDPHIALPEAVALCFHVASKLHRRIGERSIYGQASFHFDDRAAHLDVDTATISERRLQLDIEHVAFGEVQPRGQQQHPHIGLHRRLGAALQRTVCEASR